MRKSRSVILWRGIGSLALLFVSCGGSDGPSGETSESLEKEVPVEIMTIEKGTLTQKITATGSVAAWREVMVGSETSGRITQWWVDVGDWRDAGEPIAQVDDELRRLAVEQGKAQLLMGEAQHERAEQDLARGESLYTERSIASVDIDGARLQEKIARANLDQTRAALRMAERHLRDTVIRSPIAGRVAQRLVEIGEMVAPGTPVATIVDITKVKVLIGVSEEDIVRVHKGQRVWVTVDAYPDRVFEGAAATVGITADPGTRSFTMEIEIDNQDEALKPGMVARTEIVFQHYKEVIVVSQGAIVKRGEEKVVFVSDGDRARRRTVHLGPQEDQRVIVTSGLRVGDRLILLGQNELEDGTRIRVR